MHDDTLKALYEAYEEKIEELIKVPIETIMEEVSKYLKNETGIDLTYKGLEDNYITFNMSGDANKKAILKDRLGINTEEGIQANSAAEEIKKGIIDLISKNFNGFDPNLVKLVSLDDTYGDIIFIELEVKIPNVPYAIHLNVKLYDNGRIEISAIYRGDTPEERYYKNTYDNDMLIDVLKDIQNFYINRKED